MHVLDILVVLRLYLCQISFHLVENAFSRQLALLATRIAFYDISLGMRKNKNFEFLDEKMTYVFRLFDF